MSGSSLKSFDIIVIGAGHAGVEAALIAARMGLSVAVVTLDTNRMGAMSCNPAIGGLGKGQLVKEVDALGGEMGRAIDDTGIQFRTLNLSKGAAVRSSRAQADRSMYRLRITKAVRECPGLTAIQGEASEILTEANSVVGVRLADGTRLNCRAVVVTTGTFLRGLMHTGERTTEGGRVGDSAATGLSASLTALGFQLGRLKTGTPPRLALCTIDLSRLTEQPGDDPIRPFSFKTPRLERPQISCWMTATNERTHEIIVRNKDRSPMFNGQIKSGGPRYCPSVEDKVFRFKDKLSHNIFLEPEGYDTEIVYPNGISTSLPADVQEEFVRSIVGLENVKILQHGYAVEYDHIDPRVLNRSLAAKDFNGLYFAGQINGTSGYEEAAAQGILAGINAARYVREDEPVVIDRTEAYIGVMVDDLTTLGVNEPYRMFTSRAECRLHLREDNADKRLTPLGRKVGTIDDSYWGVFEAKQGKIEAARAYLNSHTVKPTMEAREWLKGFGGGDLVDSVPMATLLKRPELSLTALAEKFGDDEWAELSEAEALTLETEIKFEGYLKRMDEDNSRVKRMESVRIPRRFEYTAVPGLSIEVREKLSSLRPETLGQASRVSGVTPAAVSLLAVYLKRGIGPTVAPQP